jgi:hypothetical protein
VLIGCATSGPTNSPLSHACDVLGRHLVAILRREPSPERLDSLADLLRLELRRVGYRQVTMCCDLLSVPLLRPTADD